MFCNKCGNEIPNGSKFCNNCGAPVVEPTVQAAAPEAPAAPEIPAAPTAEIETPVEAPRKPVFETFDWNVNEYPDTNTVEKTEDIDFNWGADPDDIRDRFTRSFNNEEAADLRAQVEAAEAPASTGLNVEDLIPKSTPAQPAFSFEPEAPAKPEAELSAAEKIDKFYTFS